LRFRSLKGAGFKANYFELEDGDPYWISGPRKDQNVVFDEDVRGEYEALIGRR